MKNLTELTKEERKIINEIIEFQQEKINYSKNRLKLMRERGWFLIARTSERHANAIQKDIDQIAFSENALQILINI